MENHDTDYRSGQIFHFDYSASYRVTDNLRLGLNGYYLKQTTDDKQNGETVRVFSFGEKSTTAYAARSSPSARPCT